MDALKTSDGESLNILDENLAALKEILPDAFSEDGIDFDVLRQLLGDAVAEGEGEEKYGLNWHGKKKARQIALTPSTGTLRPCQEESVDWDTTQNLFIEGDNLEVLKLLQRSYAGKVKMIYIDPPYNTGKEFIYPDKFQDNLDTYLQYTGQKSDEGLKLSSNTESSGRYHTNWLNMMYPRLKLAKSLLRDDGVIFISIDDHELHNLKEVCDQIYGEENFRNYIAVRRRVKSLNQQFADNGLATMNIGIEYVLVYTKSDRFLMSALRAEKKYIPQKGTWNVFWSGADRPTMRYELLDFTPITGQWRWQKEKAEEAVKNYQLYLSHFSKDMTLEEYWLSDGYGQKFIRKIPNGAGKNGGVQYWIAPSSSYLRTSDWTDIEVSQIKKDFDLPFNNPKNIKLIKTLVSLCDSKSCVVLDFFAGSATTAHAVMQLNAEDGGSRRCISVQLPEPCDEKSEAHKAGYETIAEIGKERIRRAAKKVAQENPDFEGDLGFKVFKLDSSNIRAWNPDKSDIEQTLLDHVDHLTDGRSEQDLLYELLLKRGVDLSVPIAHKQIAGKAVYSIGYGILFACMDKKIDKSEIETLGQGIIDWHKELPVDIDTQVVFRDSAFADDIAKTNITAILEQNGISHVRSI